jgi:peptidase M1-like protein
MTGQGARRRGRAIALGIAAAAVLLVAAPTASAGWWNNGTFTPGADGAGDPYFPTDGNGGYDAKHYTLDVRYDPATDLLQGEAEIIARATQNLSSFNLDLQGLTVDDVEVNGRNATWTRSGDELTITPRSGIKKHHRFVVEIDYHGVPQTLPDGSGFIHTDDGTLVIGEPHVADTWYPVNDHPSDKASYEFFITVPAGLEAIANGELEGKRTSGGWTTWNWEAKEPMASYLTTATIGEFIVRSYKKKGVRYWDAFDPDLYGPPASPRTGSQFAISQSSQPSYKRLMRTISVPAGGATVSFWVDRQTEQNWDFVFVEAHTVGMNNWTTLPDLNGHTTQDVGNVCPYWLDLHPFLEHYQTPNADGSCDPTGTTGTWNARSGESQGYEQWRVSLAGFASQTVELSITYASDDLVQYPGVFVDDIVVSTGAGTTSFEADGNTMDGWTVPGAPAGSEPNPNDWIVGGAADAGENWGPVVDASFARQTEILEWEESLFGPYPFSASGGIVDDLAGVGFALENQTRPIYAKDFFTDAESGQSVIVHELAHQWFGDSLAVEQWKNIWLNEGFAQYTEWLWSEREGLGTAQEIFDFYYGVIPEDDPFWSVVIGDPGPDLLFDIAIYYRGAMTLHQLRVTVGDRDFFRILRTWAQTRRGDNVEIPEFIRLAEKISHEDLDDLFEAWLFTPGRPELPAAAAAQSLQRAQSAQTALGGLAAKQRLGWLKH